VHKKRPPWDGGLAKPNL